MYDLEGTIKLISAVQTYPSGFSKREFVVTTQDDKYPQDIKLELVKEKCDLLNNFKLGDNVKVGFRIRGNEYQGKYFVNLQAWKLEAAGAGGSRSSDSRSTLQEPNHYHDDGIPDDPFADEENPF